jgi:tetratricopeptide (TPR) repeat protein
VGSTLFAQGDFENAFNAFNTILQTRELLRSKGNNSIYSKDEEYRQMQFNAGICAKRAGKPELASDIFQSLVDADYPSPTPYIEVFNSLINDDEAAAFVVLDKGKKACSKEEGTANTSEFLFAEINYFLKNGQYEKLESRLQAAIEAQPDNVSLYYALGTVYDGLFQKADKAGEKETAESHFKEAKKYYEKTLELNDKHADASYNIGALYYNSAANMNATIKQYDSDLSNEGIRKYNALKGEQKKLMETSKPFFERALDMNPSHRGSMKALQGIAAYNNDKATADKYKAMLEAVE